MSRYSFYLHNRVHDNSKDKSSSAKRFYGPSDSSTRPTSGIDGEDRAERRKQSAISYLITAGEKAKYVTEVCEASSVGIVEMREEWAKEFEEKEEMLLEEHLKGIRAQLLTKEGVQVNKQSRTKILRRISLRLKNSLTDSFLSWKSRWSLARRKFTLDDMVSVVRIELPALPIASEDSNSSLLQIPPLRRIHQDDLSKESLVCVRLTNSSRLLDLLVSSAGESDVYISYFKSYIKSQLS